MRPQYSRASISAQVSDETARAIRTLTDWRLHSAPGDFSRALWIPQPMARAYYGADTPMEFCDSVLDLLDGGDVAFLNTGEKIVAVLDLDAFEALAEAA